MGTAALLQDVGQVIHNPVHNCKNKNIICNILNYSIKIKLKEDSKIELKLRII